MNFQPLSRKKSGILAFLLFQVLSGITVSLYADPLPLGTITLKEGSGCPEGYNCVGFTLQCPGVNHITGFIADRPSLTTPRGLVLFFNGGGSTTWYTVADPDMVPVIEELRAGGFAIVMARFATDWFNSNLGNDQGMARMACRPSTLVKFIHDNYYLPLGIPTPPPGKAGFAVTGSSGGSNIPAYALTHYGLENIIDVAIPTGGPTFSALAKGCMNTAGEEPFWIGRSARNIIDRAYGFTKAKSGPCYWHDSSYVPRWLEDAVSTGGNDYYHPETRVHILVGHKDYEQRWNATEYFNRMVSEGTPYVIFEVVPNAPHRITLVQQGRDAFKNAVMQ